MNFSELSNIQKPAKPVAPSGKVAEVKNGS